MPRSRVTKLKDAVKKAGKHWRKARQRTKRARQRLVKFAEAELLAKEELDGVRTRLEGEFPDVDIDELLQGDGSDVSEDICTNFNWAEAPVSLVSC